MVTETKVLGLQEAKFHLTFDGLQLSHMLLLQLHFELMELGPQNLDHRFMERLFVLLRQRLEDLHWTIMWRLIVQNAAEETWWRRGH